MKETESGMDKNFKPLQLLKACSPMPVTELGISMEVKLLHPSKALLPTAVTEFGISTDVNPLQSWYLQIILYQLLVL